MTRQSLHHRVKNHAKPGAATRSGAKFREARHCNATVVSLRECACGGEIFYSFGRVPKIRAVHRVANPRQVAPSEAARSTAGLGNATQRLYQVLGGRS